LLVGVLFSLIHFLFIYRPDGGYFLTTFPKNAEQYPIWGVFLFVIAWITMLIGKVKLSKTVRTTVIKTHTFIGLFMWMGMLPIVIILLIYSFNHDFIESAFIIGPIIIFPWSHVAIGLPLYKIGGKKVLFIILFLDLLNVPMMYYLLLIGFDRLIPLWSTIWSLTPFIMLMIMNRQLLKISDLNNGVNPLMMDT